MKSGDIKHIVDIDIIHPFIYEVKIIEKNTQLEDHWNILYTKVIFDFLNKRTETLEGVEGFYDARTHIFDTVEEAIHAITSSEWGMKEKAMMMRLFK